MPTLFVSKGKSTVDKYSQIIFEYLKYRSDIKKIEVKTPHAGLWKSNFLIKYPTFLCRILILKLKAIQSDGIVHLPHEGFAAYSHLIPSKSKTVITVHEVSSFLFPECREHSYIQSKIEKNLKRTDHIIADSEHTKKDLKKILGIPDSKITVVHLGVDHRLFIKGLLINSTFLISYMWV